MFKALISPNRFISLSLSEKVKVLYKQGSFIVSIRYYGYKINLFLLNDYYVEVFHNHKLDKIEKIDLMNLSNKRIKFYTDQIKFSEELFS